MKVLIMFQSVTTIINDNEVETTSIIPETGAKSKRHYFFTDEECIVVSIAKHVFRLEKI